MSTLVSVRVFEYHELSDSAKQTVRQADMYFQEQFLDELVDDLKQYELREHRGLETLELHYAWAFCQGDGCGFSGEFKATDCIDPKFAHIFPMLAGRRKAVGKHTFAAPAVNAIVTIDRAHHQNTPYAFNVTTEIVVSDDGESADYADEADEAINEAINVYLTDLAHELYDKGAEQILNDEDWALDYYADREMQFFATGKRFHDDADC